MQFSGNTSTLNVEISDKSGIAISTAVNYIKSGEKEIENAVTDGITQFNSNATAKTTAYNNNAAEKTTAYNENATAKLSAYNENDTIKTAAYNQNATEKTTAFNANATSKTADFNTNAGDKTTAFDNNASAKTTAFNTNATSKTTAFNTNASEKQAAVDASATAAAASASTSKQWAVGEPTEPTGNSSKYWAQSAAASASNMANRDLSNLSSDGQMIVDSQNGTISNCILDIPQNLKLEFSNGTVTLKAGSIITRTGSTYSTVTTTQDITWSSSTQANKKLYLFASNSGNAVGLYNTTTLKKVGSGDTLPANNDTYSNFYLTTDKIIYSWSNGSWQASNLAYPLGIIETDENTNITGFAKDSNGNDMIFNGACFIGHHAVVYPNVKALIPNGFNEDGSLNNIEVTTTSLLLNEMNTANVVFNIGKTNIRYHAYIEVDNIDDVLNPINYGCYYARNTNTMHIWHNTWSIIKNTPIIFFTYKGTTVTQFTIRQPVRMATTEMLDKKQDTLTFDTTPTNASTNPVTSGGVYTALAAKADDNAVVKITGNQTIAGSKTFTDKVTTQFNLLDYKGYYVQNSAISKGTVPITNTGGQFTFQDTTGLGATARLGGCEVRYLSSGEIQATLQAFKPEANSSTRAEISIIYPALGDAYTSAPTPPINSNSTNIATTAYVNNKFQVVNALPASPDADTFYFIPES